MRIRNVVFFLSPILSSGAAMAADDKICAPDMVCASKPETVVTSLQDAGFRAKLENGSDGATITSASSGYNFYVDTNDCEGGLKCSSLQFNVLFASDERHTAAYANGFNLRYRYLQLAAKDNNELRLTYDIDTTGGLTKANFNSVLNNWAKGLGVFLIYVRDRDAITNKAFPPAPPK
jgi:hypothetical protein